MKTSTVSLCAIIASIVVAVVAYFCFENVKVAVIAGVGVVPTVAIACVLAVLFAASLGWLLKVIGTNVPVARVGP
jgi:hypothetical protein